MVFIEISFFISFFPQCVFFFFSIALSLKKYTSSMSSSSSLQQPNPPTQTPTQTQILTELNQTNQTLSLILQTLQSIEENVSPSNPNSVYCKQEKCIISLKRFEGIGGGGDGKKEWFINQFLKGFGFGTLVHPFLSRGCLAGFCFWVREKNNEFGWVGTIWYIVGEFRLLLGIYKSLSLFFSLIAFLWMAVNLMVEKC